MSQVITDMQQMKSEYISEMKHNFKNVSNEDSKLRKVCLYSFNILPLPGYTSIFVYTSYLHDEVYFSNYNYLLCTQWWTCLTSS